MFWANMTVGETVLRSAPLTLESPLSVYQDANDFEAQTVPQLQEQQLTAAPQLLCTGEVEDVRGNAGTFPQSLAPLQAKQQSIFHPKGEATGLLRVVRGAQSSCWGQRREPPGTVPDACLMRLHLHVKHSAYACAHITSCPFLPWFTCRVHLPLAADAGSAGRPAECGLPRPAA